MPLVPGTPAIEKHLEGSWGKLSSEWNGSEFQFPELENTEHSGDLSEKRVQAPKLG